MSAISCTCQPHAFFDESPASGACTWACLSVAPAAALAVSVFRAYPQQRGTLMDEVLTTVVSNISLLGSRGPPRLYEATDAAQKPLPIMMASALVMQLVQVG